LSRVGARGPSMLADESGLVGTRCGTGRGPEGAVYGQTAGSVVAKATNPLGPRRSVTAMKTVDIAPRTRTEYLFGGDPARAGRGGNGLSAQDGAQSAGPGGTAWVAGSYCTCSHEKAIISHGSSQRTLQQLAGHCPVHLGLVVAAPPEPAGEQLGGDRPRRDPHPRHAARSRDAAPKPSVLGSPWRAGARRAGPGPPASSHCRELRAC
jgi:hypothetical protein